ncbi:MAG: phenylalanine--tRNA ligase subunit beta, partial [Lentisphaerae bacterium]|nr:phenylalanine--tRNA ligase subunit beta [Lentisphaerota bacterium]
MKVSHNWLSQYIDISFSDTELVEKLTMAGVEVEDVIKTSIPAGIIVAEILERKPHPNADKLSVCRVSTGKEELQIVCGAPNCDAGQKVALATIGTVFAGKESGKDFQIKKAKLRGVE